MKHLFTLAIICLCITACKKDDTRTDNKKTYREHVKQALKDSMGTAIVDQLDFSQAVLSEVDSTDLHFLTIPFESSSNNNFVMVQTDKVGNIRRGRLIGLKKQDATAPTSPLQFNGNITIRSLKEQILLQSTISNGSIVSLHQRRSSIGLDGLPQEELLVQPDDAVLPEVVVVGYIPPSGGISYSDWISIQSMFGGGGGIPSNSYAPMSGSGGGNGGTYGGNGVSGGGGGVSQVPPMELEKENVYSLPAIDLRKAFKCFDYVPSSGATYTIKLCADLPSNNNPNASTNYSSVSAGHTFLIVTKANDDVSVTQSFGFYPQTAPSWYEPFSPVAATIRDNGAQEINASITMSINESQFNSIKQNAIALSLKQYDLGEYNCTNYALDVFNSARITPIIVQPYKVILPGSTDPYNPAADPVSVVIQESPQRLFSKLSEMKYGNSTESSNILIDQSHNTRAPISKGECD